MTTPTSRAWTIAQELRARRGWLLDRAAFQRAWRMRLGATAFEVSAHVLLLFESPSMVVQLAFSFREDTPRAIATEIVQHVRASLGERYRGHPRGDHLVGVVRDGQPRQLLAEIAHVEHALGGRAARRVGPSPRSKDRRRWYVVEALRAWSWPITSSSFARTIGDEHGHLHASLGVLVDSASGRPGLAANVDGWVPRTNRRWTRFCERTAANLAATGFRVGNQKACEFHFLRWVEGLSRARASKQADELEHWLEAGADVVR